MGTNMDTATRVSAALPQTRSQGVLLVATCLACVCALLAMAGLDRSESRGTDSGVRGSALLGTWEEPHGIGIDQEPWSAPKNLWLYWGSTTNRRMTGSGEKIRHIFKMGNIAGGEWRDPKFSRSITGSLFRRMSQRCCITMLFPPFEWDFPIYNPSKAIAQRLRSFVANGNSMVFTGGTMDFEFINRYFFYQLEAADGNYSPGPFPMLPGFSGLTADQKNLLKPAPRILPQKGIAVTAIKKESLPQGSTAIYASPHNTPVFLIKFCMAENPMNEPSVTYPPVKVLPHNCPASAKAGRPCSCGNICFLGYNYVEQYPGRWDDTLKIMVDLCSVVPPENSNPNNYFPPSDAHAAKAAACAEDKDGAGCADAAEATEKAEEEGWQGNYKLGAEDSDEDKLAHAAWADRIEAKHMAGGLGGSRAGVLVNNPNNPYAVGPVRGTQMNTPQTQHHSSVPLGRVEAEMRAVTQRLRKVTRAERLHVQGGWADSLGIASGDTPPSARSRTRGASVQGDAEGERRVGRKMEDGSADTQVSSGQGEALRLSDVWVRRWNSRGRGRRGRAPSRRMWGKDKVHGAGSARGMRERAAVTRHAGGGGGNWGGRSGESMGMEGGGLRGRRLVEERSGARCGPLCQLRRFVRDDRKIAQEAHQDV